MLDFPVSWCKLKTGIASAHEAFPIPSSFHSYFSKSICKPAKFNIRSFAPEIVEYQQGPLCLRILLGVFLSFLEQVLGGTYICCEWGTSGFFLADLHSHTSHPKPPYNLFNQPKQQRSTNKPNCQPHIITPNSYNPSPFHKERSEQQ